MTEDGSISMFIETISAGDNDCNDMYWAILKQNNEFAAKTFKYMSTFLRIRGELGGKFWRYCDRDVGNLFKFIKALVSKKITWADVLKDMLGKDWHEPEPYNGAGGGGSGKENK